MTAESFIAKWSKVDLTERSAAQAHFLDLCELVGHPIAGAAALRYVNHPLTASLAGAASVSMGYMENLHKIVSSASITARVSGLA